MKHQTEYLIAGNGYWGRGATEAEAIANAQWLTKDSKVVMARCHPETRVNEMGQVCYPSGKAPSEWVHGKVGGTKAVRKFVPNR